MNKRSWVWQWLGILAAFSLILSGCGLGGQTKDGAQASVVSVPPATGTFERANGPRALSFPVDHGAHNDFQTEWWYFTGNLTGADGRRFGYQFTLFRRALAGSDQRATRESSWAAEQVYLAHFALSDISGGQFHAFERLSRGAAGLAGAVGVPEFRAWLDDWSVTQTAPNTFRMMVEQDGIALDLTLVDNKGPVLQGDQGYSQKGPDPGNASIYYSLTRLETSGTVTLDGQSVPASGASWMDHEFSTSALSGQQSGWDWFALQLNNGYELMVYTIRSADGGIDPYSRGILVAPDGSSTRLGRSDFEIAVGESRWTSPRSGARYPNRWTVSVPEANLRLDVTPAMPDQELNLSFTYWEGAVSISGTQNGQPVSGQGYVELTGYAKSMQGEF